MVNAPTIAMKDIDFNWSYIESFTTQPYSNTLDLDASCYKSNDISGGGPIRGGNPPIGSNSQ